MLFATMAVYLAVTPAIAAAATYDACVKKLYSFGGMSQWRARMACLQEPSDAVLSCQNHRFLLDFLNPNEALNACKVEADPKIPAPKPDELYHGVYEPLPQADGRKTVCFVTVNSADEKAAFLSKLDPAKYSGVELLPFSPPGPWGRFVVRDEDWLERSCRQKVRCDTLVVSGHFAAAFIGESSFDVRLNDLSRYSCRADCNDFFSSVKEVYLFGCNTLANRSLDSRTIEQYREVLIQDGVASHDAQRIAARRYTEYGRPIRDEMLSLFPNARHVFGYPSLGPTGRNVRPTLESFLRETYKGDQEILDPSLFARTLGRGGMIRLPGRAKAPEQCSAGESVLISDKLQAKPGIFAYVKKYGQRLPVPAIDIVDEAESKNLLTKTEAQGLRQRLMTQLNGLPVYERKHLVCPLLATGHRSLLSDPDLCLSDMTWMCSQADTPAQCATRLMNPG